MSSFFLFNSVGVIDEQAISQLSLTTTLSKNIVVTNNKDANDEYSLSYYTPKFMWIIRDFTLELQDASGRKISSNQYMENALTDQVDNSLRRNFRSNFFFFGEL
jgi:hypothetical protein